MYKNVQVNHCNNATTTTATAAPTFSSSSPSSFPFGTNQTSTSLPVQITSASSSSFSSSVPITRLPSSPNSNISVTKTGDGGISLPVSFSSTNENMSLSQSAKLKSDVDQLDDLVKDLLTEVNRPLGSNTNNRISSSSNNNNRNNNNNQYPTSSSSYYYQRHSNNNDSNELSNSKLPSSVRASSYTQASTLNNQRRNDFDANTVSGLIDGTSVSSNGVQREEQRVKTTREERIRIKRSGGAGGGTSDVTDIPISNTSMRSTTTTTTTNKPSQMASAKDQLSIDEQLIDSLLESVQNTLRKRSQQQTHQTTWTADIPVHHQQPTTNRRTYSSSAAYTDSVHRVSNKKKLGIVIIIGHTLIIF